MNRCRYCEAVDDCPGRKCRNCGAAFLDPPKASAVAGPLASFQGFIDATAARPEIQKSADEMYQHMVRLARIRRGIIFPSR